MSDEPRRSSRAPKPKNNDADSLPQPKESKRTKGKSKKSKPPARDQDHSEDGVEEDDAAIVRCICGVQEDEGGRMMICCDKCDAWQHNDCMGVPENPAPDSYMCEQCNPNGHRETIDALARGEKIWLKRLQELKNLQQKKGGKKSKGARQSKGYEDNTDISFASSLSESSGTARNLQQGPERTKRKLDVPDTLNGQAESTIRRGSSHQTYADQAGQMKKRKSNSSSKGTVKTTSALETSQTLVGNIAELPSNGRRNVATTLQAKFAEQIRDLSKKGMYRIPDGHTADSLGDEYAILMEYALFANHSRDSIDPSQAYKEQFRSLSFNIGKNATLLQRLLANTLTPDELSTMTSDEMASEELQKINASLMKEVEKQSILVSEEAPRFRRTHRGDELIDDQIHQVANDSITSSTPLVRHRESALDELDQPVLSATTPTTNAFVMPEVTAEVSAPVHTPLGIAPSYPIHPEPSDRKTSTNFDINNVWSSVQSPDQEQPRLLQQPPRRSGSGISHQQRPLQNDQDADIDRLLNDEENNDEPPYSPTDYTFNHGVVWKGRLHMTALDRKLANFETAALHVAGADIAMRVPFASLFPDELRVDGRIEDEKADQYLCGLSAARSTDVTVLDMTLTAPHDEEAQAQFDNLFTYFSARNRYGVVGEKHHRDHVKDIYVVPLKEGASEMPLFLQRLDYNIIEQPRPRQMLLAVFVVKWSSARHSAQATPTEASAAAPIAHAISAMSPLAIQEQQAVLSTYAVSSFPQNPYAPESLQQSILGSAPIYQQPIQPYSTMQMQPDRARQILGPFFDSPTAQQILSSPDNLTEAVLHNLRHILQLRPELQYDFDAFQRVLAKGTAQGMS